jgi:hypothetical protein
LRQSIWSRADDDRIQFSPHFLESAVLAPVVRPRQRIAVGIGEHIRLGQSPGVVPGVRAGHKSAVDRTQMEPSLKQIRSSNSLSGTSNSHSWGRKESQRPWHFRCRVKGIVWGDREWYNPTFKAVRRWFNLETNDVSEASSGSKNCSIASLARKDSLELDCTRFANKKLGVAFWYQRDA